MLVLKHVKGRTNEKSKDVTTLDWNVSYVSLIYFVIRPIKFLVIDVPCGCSLQVFFRVSIC